VVTTAPVARTAPIAPTAPVVASGQPARSAGAPGRRRTRRLLFLTVTAALLAVTGSLVGTAVTSGGRTRPPRAPSAAPRPARPPAAALTGRILAQDAHGTLVLVDPATDQVVGPAGLGSLSGEVVMAAPDRRFVTTLQGDVLAINNGGLLVQTSSPRITQALLGAPGTFADGDRAVIVVASGAEQLRTGAISALILADRRTVALGIADEAAGDPQAVGAFVSVAVAGAPNEGPTAGYFGLPDSRVERREAGQPAVRLATTAQLNIALREPANQPVHLSVFPNPAGTAVAVVLNPPLGGARNVGVVVLDRAGHVVGVVPPASGPLEYTWPSWSPDGRSLAYPSFSPSGTSLAIWRETGQLLIRTAPDNGAAFGYCLWSPDGSAILCPTSQAARDDWDQGPAGSGQLFAAHAPGTPITWLPAHPALHYGRGLRRTLNF
jgi:hypothetical protein